MRRTLSLLLVFVLLLNLYGCTGRLDSSQQSQTDQSTEDATTSPQNPQTIVNQQPMFAVSMPVVTQNYTSEDGKLLLQHIYQNLELIVPDQEIADTIIVDYLNRTDKHHTTVESLYDEVVAMHSSGKLDDIFQFQTTFEPKRLDRSIFSLLGSTVTYKGYSHPEVNIESVSYDLATGKSLNLSDILLQDADVSRLLKNILLALQQQENNIIFYEDYERIVTELFENPTNWYFSENGLVFYYSPYEIAPYSSGVISASLDYSNLTGILQDAYFPAESDKIDGQLYISPLIIDNLGQFTQIAEIIATPNSNPFILYTDGLLEDFRIQQAKNHSTHTVFASSYISPGDGIALYASIDDTFQIHYTANGKKTSASLSFLSDGTPQLKD